MSKLRVSMLIGGVSLAAAPALAKPVDLVMSLSPRVPMATLAQDVTNPASLRFHKFYTPQEIRQLAAPSDAEYQALVAHLQSIGAEIVSESPTHLTLTVRGEQALFERHFNAHVETLANGTRALRSQVSLPDAMHLVTVVNGLDNQHKRTAHLTRRAGDKPKDDTGVSLSTIRTLYGFGALYAQGLTGKGQHIAIATYDDFSLDDVNQYYQKSNVTPGPVVDKVVFNGAPQTNLDSAVETEVDVEFSGALAPAVAIHVFSSSTNDDAGEEQLFTAILDDNRAKVVNYSWGECENQLTDAHKAAMDTIFQRAVAQGVNILNASGDSGSGCPDADTLAPDWPASHGSIVAVGGTTLDTSKNALSETAWNGSGGGISAMWDLPSYQSSFKAPYGKRSYPDVSFNADPNSGQAVWANDEGSGAEYIVIGGTSIASPQWSGFLALVGEARATAGKSTLGFLNPIIYGLSDSDKAAAFDDVTSGSDGAYTAVAGWDAVTGWGGLKASGLAPLLIAN